MKRGVNNQVIRIAPAISIEFGNAEKSCPLFFFNLCEMLRSLRKGYTAINRTSTVEYLAKRKVLKSPLPIVTFHTTNLFYSAQATGDDDNWLLDELAAIDAEISEEEAKVGIGANNKVAKDTHPEKNKSTMKPFHSTTVAAIERIRKHGRSKRGSIASRAEIMSRVAEYKERAKK